LKELAMKPMPLPAFLIALLLAGPGCGGDTHESLAGEAMTNMKALVATLDGVTDAPSAKAAKSKLQSLMEKLNNINDRQAKLKTPTEAEFKSIDAKYGKEMEDLQMKMAGHMMRISFDPKIAAELKDIDMRRK
jgi:hypothetical protein